MGRSSQWQPSPGIEFVMAANSSPIYGWAQVQRGVLRRSGVDYPQEFRLLRAGLRDTILTMNFLLAGHEPVRFSGRIGIPVEELVPSRIGGIYFTMSDDLQQISISGDHPLLQNGDVLLTVEPTPPPVAVIVPPDDPTFELAPNVLHLYHAWRSGHIASGYTDQERCSRYLESLRLIPLINPKGNDNAGNYWKFDIACSAKFAILDALTILGAHYDFSESFVPGAWYVWLRKKPHPSQ